MRFRLAHASALDHDVVLSGKCDGSEWYHEEQIRSVRLDTVTIKDVAFRRSVSKEHIWKYGINKRLERRFTPGI